jgi:hypothetical protein
MRELTGGIKVPHLPAPPIGDNNATVGKLSHTTYAVEGVHWWRGFIARQVARYADLQIRKAIDLPTEC